MYNECELLTIQQAHEWATHYLNKQVTVSNISYLIQYGRIKKIGNNGTTLIYKKELMRYYDSFRGKREIEWKDKLGEDLNWALSFDNLKESDTTKHVHRLHPYKGKFIPQLVEYFLDKKTDAFKKEIYFQDGDIILDPFCGSGTTLVQANELGMHAMGVDISAFNALISNVKVENHNFLDIENEIKEITRKLKEFVHDTHTIQFEKELTEVLKSFNDKYFPSPEYKYSLSQGTIHEFAYAEKKGKEFLPLFMSLVKKHAILLHNTDAKNFLDKWYVTQVRKEIDFVFSCIKNIKNRDTKKVISIILSRTMRSCRATTHADLATLKEPITTTYYCAKHGKICKPLFSIVGWWERYSADTLERLMQFDGLRTDTLQRCITGDARNIDIFEEMKKKNFPFFECVQQQKIKGIFSSPPYVGLIDYHEQHAYAYDLFGFKRKDALEIGPLFKGQGKEARESYIQGIADVLNNCKKFLAENYHVFLVSNDKYNLYPRIAEKAGMRIVNTFKRPVLNRTEKDKAAYAEIIFHLKKER